MQSVLVITEKLFFREPSAPLSRRHVVASASHTQKRALTSPQASPTLSSFPVQGNTAIRGRGAGCIVLVLAFVAAVLVPLAIPSLSFASIGQQNLAGAPIVLGVLSPLPLARPVFPARLASIGLPHLARHTVPAHVSRRGDHAANRGPDGVFPIGRPTTNRLPLLQRQRRVSRLAIQTTESLAPVPSSRTVGEQVAYFSMRIAPGLPWSAGPPADPSFAVLPGRSPSPVSSRPARVEAPSKRNSITSMASCVDDTFVRLTKIASGRKCRIVSLGD